MDSCRVERRLTALLIVLAGTIPFMSFVAERWVTKQVRPLLDAA